MFSMERLASCGVIPVVVLNDVADAVPTARALLRGGGAEGDLHHVDAAAQQRAAAST